MSESLYTTVDQWHHLHRLHQHQPHHHHTIIINSCGEARGSKERKEGGEEKAKVDAEKAVGEEDKEEEEEEEEIEDDIEDDDGNCVYGRRRIDERIVTHVDDDIEDSQMG